MAAKPRLESVLFVPDTHRPYHDPKAWSLLLSVGKALKPSHLMILGDFCDFYCVSAHSKDPTRATQLETELADVRRGLDDLDALGATDKRYCGGNHEDRLTRYLQDKAPELFESVTIPGLLGLEDRGWRYVPYKHDTRLGKLYLTHDVDNAGRYATFKALDAYQHSVVTGHAHRMCYVVEGNAVGEHKLSAQFGWLGDAEAIDYLHRVRVRKDWALGFGIGYLDTKTSIVYATPVPIITKGSTYSCVVNGDLYTA